MPETSRDKWTPRNPLGVIALFVFLIETIATASLKIVADKSFALILVWFIVLYPTTIALAFFLFLWHKREALFGPMDFADQSDFSKLLLQKVERIAIKQDAAGIDSATMLNDVFGTIDKLIVLSDPWSAIQIGRAFLKERDFDKAFKVFQYLSKKISPSDESYYRVLSNLAYSQIGLGHYADAIGVLMEVKLIKGGRHFRAWHNLAISYAYLKSNDRPNSEKFFASVSSLQRADLENLDLNFFANLYPEMADRILALR
ncbi:hypothetical protein JAO29_20205 [Edaphobacter sp. HDX4]|uniref:tetratricopeptide repeat protein n=1 Tax=Edaphobacter sp. HDX4 TaxID=2794064 RepID=UPI002FE59C4D